MAHFVERGRNQSGKPDDVRIVRLGGFQNFGRRNHDAEVNDFVVVALKHNANDVLSDIVDIAFYRRHHDLAARAAVLTSVL